MLTFCNIFMNCKLCPWFPYLYKSRIWRLPSTVPTMMKSDTRWTVVTCSSVVKEDSRHPFTE